MVENLIIFVDTLPYFPKSELNAGRIPSPYLMLSDFLTSFFLLSHGIRQENQLSLYILENQWKFQFSGVDLRYLAPDERTTIGLLRKALDIAEARSKKRQDQKLIRRFAQNEIIESTPGLFIQNITLDAIQKEIETLNALYRVNFSLKKNCELPSLPLPETLVYNYSNSTRIAELLSVCLQNLEIPGVLSKYKATSILKFLLYLQDRSVVSPPDF